MKNKKILSIVLLLAIMIFFVSFGEAKIIRQNEVTSVQTGNAVLVSDYKLNSKLTAREMPYRVMLPKNYESDKQTRFPVIYLLHGLTGHFDNWSDKTKLAEYLAPYNFIVVMPEGDNGWFTDSATVPNDKYESYITQELIPEIDKNFRTVADRRHRAIAGLSMGGYGSLKFGLKHPEMFVLAGSFSGALGAAGWTDAMFAKMNLKGEIPDSIRSVFGADDSPTRRENDIFQMVKNITPEQVKTLPFIYQSCGTEDFLIQNNHDFLNLLDGQKIPHEYQETPGIHNWVFWDAQIQEFLRLGDKILNKARAKTA
ncbi:MAG: alpha/beta hydrolase [Pyrinomonadaceae bacterium]